MEGRIVPPGRSEPERSGTQREEGLPGSLNSQALGLASFSTGPNPF